MRNLLEQHVVVRAIRVGETLNEFDLWNTQYGLKKLPFDKRGTKLAAINPRDIYLRPLSMLSNLTSEEMDRWVKTDHI